MKKTLHHIHEAEINNNCPRCYSTHGLKLDFYQPEVENALYRKNLNSVSATLHCSKCDSEIYPVQWDTDIERVEAYHRKLAVPRPPGLQLKPLAYGMIVLAVLLAIIAVSLLL